MPECKTAGEIMKRRLVTLSLDTPVLDGVNRLLKNNISGAPVLDEGNRYVGVFSEKCSINALTKSVEIAAEKGMHIARAREFMTCGLITVTADVDVFEAIDHLLVHRISGAPVVDSNGGYQGSFSEKTAMQVLASAAYDQLPGTNVGAYMDRDRKRVITEECSLLDVAHVFQNTRYRRLPVLRGDQLVGQVSRRDVLREEFRIAKDVDLKASQDSADERFGQAGTKLKADEFVDRFASTTAPDEDLWSIAQVFLQTPYRRLPVLEREELIGQVSRRDLLNHAAALLRPTGKKPKAETLYLSPLADSMPSRFG